MQFTVELWADESVDVQVNDGEASVNGKVIPAEMFDHVIRFGFRQLIRDAGAISKEVAAKPNADEVRNEAARKKIEALIAGTLREGSGGGPRLTAVERHAKVIALRKVDAKVLRSGLGLTRKTAEELAEKLFKRDREELIALAEAELAADAASDDDLDLTELAKSA